MTDKAPEMKFYTIDEGIFVSKEAKDKFDEMESSFRTGMQLLSEAAETYKKRLNTAIAALENIHLGSLETPDYGYVALTDRAISILARETLKKIRPADQEAVDEKK